MTLYIFLLSFAFGLFLSHSVHYVVTAYILTSVQGLWVCLLAYILVTIICGLVMILLKRAEYYRIMEKSTSRPFDMALLDKAFKPIVEDAFKKTQSYRMAMDIMSRTPGSDPDDSQN